MANRKTNEKLKVPAEFRLKSYSPLRDWTEPRPWLEQFAFRIDLLLLWQKVLTHRQSTDSAKPSISVGEFYLNEMLSHIWDDPLAPVQKYLKDYPRPEVEFPTLEFVEHGFDPVRRMSVLDLYLAECVLHPLTRLWGRSFSQRLQKAVPFPEEELRWASLVEEEAAFLSYEPLSKVAARDHLLKRYWEDVEDNVREKQSAILWRSLYRRWGAMPFRFCSR